MSSELCIARIFCNTPEAWSVWAAWFQAVLTILTFWYSTRYQKWFNERQIQRESLLQKKAEEEKRREDERLFFAGLLVLRRARLEYIRELRASIEGRFEYPMDQWVAIKAALSNTTHFDDIERLVKLHPVSEVLLKTANMHETVKHIPLDKRAPASGEEAQSVIESIKPDIKRMLEYLEEVCRKDGDLIDRWNERP
jgi:hypothetical protein